MEDRYYACVSESKWSARGAGLRERFDGCTSLALHGRKPVLMCVFCSRERKQKVEDIKRNIRDAVLVSTFPHFPCCSPRKLSAISKMADITGGEAVLSGIPYRRLRLADRPLTRVGGSVYLQILVVERCVLPCVCPRVVAVS